MELLDHRKEPKEEKAKAKEAKAKEEKRGKNKKHPEEPRYRGNTLQQTITIDYFNDDRTFELILARQYCCVYKILT